MTVILALVLFALLLDVAALTGWAPSTRDGGDWHRADSSRARRGPVHVPAEWVPSASSAASGGARRSRTVDHHAG